MKIQLIGGPRNGTFYEFNTSLRYLEIPIASPTGFRVGRYRFDEGVLRWIGERPLWDGKSETVEEFR